MCRDDLLAQPQYKCSLQFQSQISDQIVTQVISEEDFPVKIAKQDILVEVSN